ncbi:MAG: putative internalin [Fibrobacteres bacterium]|nr:putative internalin [Fibrobacterota bacterium]
MLRVTRFWVLAFVLISVSVMSLWNCNLSEPKDTATLKMSLPDSLTKAKGYDSVVVDIYDRNGKLTHKGVFAGEFNPARDSAKLANLQLNGPIPNPMVIKINGYKGKENCLVIEIDITNGRATQNPPVYVEPGSKDSIPSSISINGPSPLQIYVGGESIFLSAAVLPTSAPQTIIWTMPVNEFAVIEAGNKIKGLKVGSVEVTAASSVKPEIKTTLMVNVGALGVKPTSISILVPTPMVLAEGGAKGDLAARIYPEGVSQEIVWSITDTAKAVITFENKVKPLKAGKTTITAKSKEDPKISASFELNIIVPIKVGGISLSPSTMSIYSGGDEGKLTVSLIGSDTSGAVYALASSDAAFASVSAEGSVKGWKSGTAYITASVVGYPAISSVCTVTVITDPPIPTITADQTITFGAEAVFDISVTQANGTVAEIKADMDGDGIYEQTVLAKSTAQFKAKYSQAKTYSLNFQIKDSEGNKVDVHRNVIVNPPAAPIVDIFDPATDITINQLSYTIRFTVKDPSSGIDISKDSLVNNLVDGKNTVIVSRVNAGGTGKDQVVLDVNRSAPGVPALVSQPLFTNDNTPTWTWGPVAGAAKYQVRFGDGDFTKTQGNIEKTTLNHTLNVSPDGEYVLYVRSVDALGNASSAASQSVTVDTKAPDTVSFSGTENGFTSDNPPTWSWSPSLTNGGINSYEVTLDGAALPVIVNGTVFTPSALSDNQTHTLSVRQKDRVEGVLGAAKSFRYQIAVNAPAAPTVSGPSGVPDNGPSRFLNFSWTSGARGLDIYRIKVNSEGAYRESNNTTRTFSLPSTTPDGTYTIRVQELDGLGRWGAEGTFTIVLDRTFPALAISTRNNFITNTTPVAITYKIDNVAAPTVNCTLTKINQANTCTVSETDAAGNKTDASITVYYRPNTYFINANNSVDGDGSSWEKAKKDPTSLIAIPNNPKNEYWVASGTYPGFTPTYGISILGGFNATALPVTTSGRTPVNTFTSGVYAECSDAANLITIDNFTFGQTVTAKRCAINLFDSKFAPDLVSLVDYAIDLQNGSKLTAKNDTIFNGKYRVNVVRIGENSEATFDNSMIKGNVVNWGPGYAVAVFDGKLALSGSTSFYMNSYEWETESTKDLAVYDNSTISIGVNTSFNCDTDIEYITFTGSGTCKGNPMVKP